MTRLCPESSALRWRYIFHAELSSAWSWSWKSEACWEPCPDRVISEYIIIYTSVYRTTSSRNNQRRPYDRTHCELLDYVQLLDARAHSGSLLVPLRPQDMLRFSPSAIFVSRLADLVGCFSRRQLAAQASVASYLVRRHRIPPRAPGPVLSSRRPALRAHAPAMAANFDPPSTLKPAQVAAAMIEHGVVKHRTRADVVFFKAVRFNSWRLG